MKEKLEKLTDLLTALLFFIASLTLTMLGSVAGFQLLSEPSTVSVLLGIMLLLVCLTGSTLMILIIINYFKNKLWD